MLPVIIINYKRPETTLKCLRSVAKSDMAEQLAPIVVDSGTEHSWSEKLQKEFGDWVSYLPQSENLGFSGANNVGMKYALEKYHPEVVALLNDDTTVAKDTFSQMLKSLQSQPRAAAVVPKIFFAKGQEFHPGYENAELGSVLWYAGGIIDWKEVFASHRGVDEVDRGQYNQAEETEFATGCCVLLRAKALQEVGMFDERYFLYLEDLDLSLRFLRKGWQLWYEPQAQVWHENAGSSGSGSSLHEYYFVRNRYLFGFRYAPLRTKLFLLKHLVIQWQQGSAITKQAIKDFITGKYGKRHELHQ